MPLFAQRLVSKKKRRVKRDNFDLDLSYIWPAPAEGSEDGLPPDGQPGRLITMGFPCENGSMPTEATYRMSEQELSAHHLGGLSPGNGMRTVRNGGTSVDEWFRNPMDQVQGFLEAYHSEHYKVFNFCSERWYDHGSFHGRVSRYPFADHNCPSPLMIHACCADAAAWLAADPSNIVAFHCKAGKGRAGTMSTCLLLHMGWCGTAEEALAHYARTRTHDGKGVTIPSQIRYVEYYAMLLEQQRTALAKEGAPAPRPGINLALPLSTATIRIRAVGMGPFEGKSTHVRDRWGAGGREGTPTLRAKRLGGDVWQSSDDWGDEATYELQQELASWVMRGPARGALVRGDVCFSLHPCVGRSASTPEHKAAFWLNTGMVAAQCKNIVQGGSNNCALGCTTIERVDDLVSGRVSARTFRISITQAGLDKACKKTWADDDAFVVWMEFDIGDDIDGADLCWDSGSAKQKPPRSARGWGCCGATPANMERVGPRPGMTATPGHRYTTNWIEPEPEFEPEPEPELQLHPQPMDQGERERAHIDRQS